jgi:regulator of nucleoside diphosphate kinase
VNENPIQVTRPDFERLAALLDGWWAPDAKTRPLLERLEAELERARVVDSRDIEPGCITIGSKVALRDLRTGRLSVHALVWPNEWSRSELTLSVLSPMGIAVLGYREGDEFEYEAPGGPRRLRVERVLFQPESALAPAAATRPHGLPKE